MKNILYISLFSLFLILGSCYKYEPQFEGAYEDGEIIDSTLLRPIPSLVFVAGGNVYLTDDFFENVELINNSGLVSIASINNNHTKILWKREGQNIEVFDIASMTVTSSIPNSSDAFWFDYHANNETIWFVKPDEYIYTIGPEIFNQNPKKIFNGFGTFGNLISITVFENSDYIATTDNRVITYFNQEGIVDYRISNYYGLYKNLRLSHNEGTLWASNDDENQLYDELTPTSILAMDKIPNDDYKLGVPNGFEEGYKVEAATNIIVRNYNGNYSARLESPNGNITAIDR